MSTISTRTDLTATPTATQTVATDSPRVVPGRSRRWIIGGVAVALLAAAGAVGLRAYSAQSDVVPSSTVIAPRTDVAGPASQAELEADHARRNSAAVRSEKAREANTLATRPAAAPDRTVHGSQVR